MNHGVLFERLMFTGILELFLFAVIAAIGLDDSWFTKALGILGLMTVVVAVLLAIWTN